jgi:glutamine phosphoribosylpyrophosphate amidotransferase
MEETVRFSPREEEKGMERLHDPCGGGGISIQQDDKRINGQHYLTLALTARPHRGQESAGTALYESKKKSRKNRCDCFAQPLQEISLLTSS